MKKLLRILALLITTWTITGILFFFISFPEIFDLKKTESRTSELSTIAFDIDKISDIVAVEKNIGLKSDNKKRGRNALLRKPRLPLGDASMTYNITRRNDVFNDNENLARELRLLREENEKRYYTLRQTKVNPTNVKFIIHADHICDTDAKYMTILIIVPSIPSHYFVRDAIRSTYGSYVKDRFTLEHARAEVTVRLAFLIGKDNKNESDSIVRKESRKHGDIIYADFLESYRNLTRKMLTALSWVSVYCSDIDFMMKVDEDVFINIPKLAKELHKRPYDVQGSIYGYLYHGSSVRRYGKWAVSKNEFPLDTYPTYAAGNSYVISGNIVPRLFKASEYLPYISIEDAFITGCLARIIDAKLVYIPGFTFWHDVEPEPCKFVRDKRVSATKVTTSRMEKLWKASTNYKEYCDWRNLKNNL